MVKATSVNMIDVIEKIDQYIRRHDWPYSEWCVGIADDPREKLERQQETEGETGPWIYTTAGNGEFARAIRQHFTEILGVNREVSFEGERGAVVYAYWRGRQAC